MGVLTKDDFKELEKRFASKDDLAAVLERMDSLVTKDDLDAAVHEMLVAANEAFAAVPNRFQHEDHERRIKRLERKTARAR